MERFTIPKYDPQTGELNPYYKELTGNENEYSYEQQSNVDFVNEVRRV